MGSVPSTPSRHPSYSAVIFQKRKGAMDSKYKKEYKRRALHAGSWYENSKKDLNETLTSYLSDAEMILNQNPSQCTVDSSKLENGIEKQKVEKSCNGIPKAIIAPHAGYSYSGPTAAYAYASLREAVKSGSVETILVLHPSHHVRLDGCALSGAKSLMTPLGELAVDDVVRRELLETGRFSVMEQRDDEQEHSGEMQYPFIYKALMKEEDDNSMRTTIKDIRVLPIMIGNVHASKAMLFGELLAPIIARTNVFTVISTDFCHWGERFQYTPFERDQNKKKQKIFQYIQWLDNVGMNHIEMQDPGAFQLYLKKTRNTICGRFPLTVWLNAVQFNREEKIQALDVQFLRYAQSSQIEDQFDSSVSYASGVARLSSF